MPKNHEVIYFEIKGCIAPAKTRGDNKGRPNWRKADKTTERVVCITPAEHDVWLGQYEQKTGKCSKCDGCGEVFAGWSATTGVRHSRCNNCAGSGDASKSEASI